MGLCYAWVIAAWLGHAMKFHLLPLFALLASAACAAGSRAEIKIVRVPDGGQVPEVVLDSKGVLHLTYGRGSPGNAYYVQSHNGGRSFTPPVQLNRQPNTVTTGMERGPKLAVGKDGIVHVTWLGYYKIGGGIWYTRSVDGGRTFEPERNLLDTETGCDNATVTADRQGNVFVLWTDGRLGPDPNSPVASPIFMARSTDSGATFSKNEPVHHDYPGRACGCCRLEAQVGGDGNLYIAFRGGYQNIRDPYLLKGRKTDNNFKAVRVSVDNWKFG
jgi:hypothetical protein